MSAALLNAAQPCALVDPAQTFVIGGQTLGFPDQLRTEFIMHIGNTHGAYLGVTIGFPRSHDSVASFFNNNNKKEKSSDLSVTIRWPLNTFDISGGCLEPAQLETLVPEQQQANEFGLLQVELRTGENSLIDGIGFPFRGIDETVDSYVNSDAKIHGRWSLRDLISQRTFYILVKDNIKASLARFFVLAPDQTLSIASYGNVHHWDINRYKTQMASENLKKTQSPARFQFNGLHDALTVITQSIAQDCWWYAQDVQEVRTIKLPFLFVKIGDKPTAETDRFWAITCLGNEFLKRFGRSANNFTEPYTELSIAFREPPAPDTYRDDGKPDRDDLSWPAKVLPCKVPSLDREPSSDWKHDYPDQATNNGNYLLLEVHRPRDPTSPAYRIRNHQVQAFLRPEKGSGGGKEDILDMFSSHGEAEMEKIYLDFYDGRVLSRRRVNATNDLFKATKLAKDALPSHDSRPEPRFSEDDDVLKTILQEFFIGRGYSYPVSEWHKIASGDSDDTRLSQAAQNLSLAEPLLSQKPQFDVEYANEAIKLISAEPEGQFKQYIKLVSLGLVGICGTRLHARKALVATTLLFLANAGTNKVHASASNHIAVREYADLLYEKGTQVVEALHERTKPDLPRHIPLVVRGHNIEKEVGSFIRLVVKGNIEWEMSKWSQGLSPCEWLLKLVSFNDFDLAPLDNPKMFHLREGFRNDKQYAGLRAFVAREIPLRKVRDFAAAGVTSYGSDAKYVNMTAQEERDSRLRAEHWARVLIKSLLEAIIENADVVCTTTHMARSSTYGTFRESSKAIVLADAGAMSKAEAIVVWGPYFKPCAMGGDVGRRTRTFINSSHKQGDRYSNHFGPEAGISILSHMMGSGNAMFMSG